MRGHTFVLQRLENFNHLALGPDHAHVACASLHRPAQKAHVVAMTSGYDDDIGSLIRFKLMNGFLKIQGMDFTCGGKAVWSGIRGAIVGDDEITPSGRG